MAKTNLIANDSGMISIDGVPYQKGSLRVFPYSSYERMQINERDGVNIVPSKGFADYQNNGVDFASAADLKTFAEENFFFEGGGGGGASVVTPQELTDDDNPWILGAAEEMRFRAVQPGDNFTVTTVPGSRAMLELEGNEEPFLLNSQEIATPASPDRIVITITDFGQGTNIHVPGASGGGGPITSLPRTNMAFFYKMKDAVLSSGDTLVDSVPDGEGLRDPFIQLFGSRPPWAGVDGITGVATKNLFADPNGVELQAPLTILWRVKIDSPGALLTAFAGGNYVWYYDAIQMLFAPHGGSSQANGTGFTDTGVWGTASLHWDGGSAAAVLKWNKVAIGAFGSGAVGADLLKFYGLFGGNPDYFLGGWRGMAGYTENLDSGKLDIYVPLFEAEADEAHV